MSNIHIEKENGKIEIYTPYSSEFVSMLKRNIGGVHWNAEKRCWVAQEEMLDAVRAILKEAYGYTDVEDAGKLYTVRLESLGASALRAPVSIFNKPVARAFSRDSGATICEDVVFVEGHPTSGGSCHKWETIIPERCVFDMMHVPEKALEKAKEELSEESCPDFKIISVTLEKGESNRDKLLAEREKLVKRIAEIDAELKSDSV